MKVLHGKEAGMHGKEVVKAQAGMHGVQAPKVQALDANIQHASD